MSSGGAIAAMIASIKNNRRKRKRKPFSGERPIKSGKPIHSKELSSKAKKELLKKLKKDRIDYERKRQYKIVLSLLLTIISIVILVSLIRIVFF